MKPLNFLTDLFLLLAFCLLFGATSCTASLETRCAEIFPRVTTTEVRTNIVPDTIIIPFSSVEYIDTTACPPGLKDTAYIVKHLMVPVPGDTIYRQVMCTDTVVINRDAVLVQWLSGQNEALKIRNANLSRTANTRLFFIIGVAVLAIVFGFLALRK